MMMQTATIGKEIIHISTRSAKPFTSVNQWGSSRKLTSVVRNNGIQTVEFVELIL
jgi:hypothetical protein